MLDDKRSLRPDVLPPLFFLSFPLMLYFYVQTCGYERLVGFWMASFVCFVSLSCFRLGPHYFFRFLRFSRRPLLQRTFATEGIDVYTRACNPIEVLLRPSLWPDGNYCCATALDSRDSQAWVKNIPWTPPTRKSFPSLWSGTVRANQTAYTTTVRPGWQ